MIRLSNIFNSKEESAPTQIEPTLARDKVFRQRSSSDSVQSSQELEITEDPEKQRARHRLLGAGLLVLVAIIGLPKVFDSAPKKVSNDVVLQMVASVVDPSTDSKNDKKKSEESKPKPETLKEPSQDEATQPLTGKSDVAKKEAQTLKEDKPVVKGNEKALSQGEEVIEEANKPNKAASKYLVNIGAFANAERAKKWGAKLKEQKIPYFTQEKKKDDETLVLLRAGPFAEKSEAEAAEKKIRAMGLNPKLVEAK